jgi:hypothetical protein
VDKGINLNFGGRLTFADHRHHLTRSRTELALEELLGEHDRLRAVGHELHPQQVGADQTGDGLTEFFTVEHNLVTLFDMVSNRCHRTGEAKRTVTGTGEGHVMKRHAEFFVVMQVVG